MFFHPIEPSPVLEIRVTNAWITRVINYTFRLKHVDGTLEISNRIKLDIRSRTDNDGCYIFYCTCGKKMTKIGDNSLVPTLSKTTIWHFRPQPGVMPLRHHQGCHHLNPTTKGVAPRPPWFKGRSP